MRDPMASMAAGIGLVSSLAFALENWPIGCSMGIIAIIAALLAIAGRLAESGKEIQSGRWREWRRPKP